MRFALETAIGPVSAQQLQRDRVQRHPHATVPRASPRSHASDGACRTTSVSAPGQNASIRSRAGSDTALTSPSSVSREPTSTGSGMSRPATLGGQQVGDRGRVERVGADAVDRVGRQHHQLPGRDGRAAAAIAESRTSGFRAVEYE